MFSKVIKKIIKKVFNNFSFIYKNNSYSQEGEDLILNKLIGNKKTGFYIDIGAHHPIRFSNTFLFYKKGWSGINIDAKPGSMLKFNKIRPRDINIELGLSTNKDILPFYIFNEPALNTFDEKLANSRISDKYYITEIKSVECYPLSEILDNSLPIDKKIDFLTIDIEGFDLKVLKSNDWDKYIPEYIIVESYEIYIEDVLNSDIYKFLINLEYKLVSKSYFSLIFKK